MKGWKGAERMGLKEKLEKRMGIGIAEATNETVYYGLLSLVKELCKELSLIHISEPTRRP